MNKALYLVKRNLPSILTGVGIALEGGAMYFSAKGAKKVDGYLEDSNSKARAYVKAYWPAGLCFAASAASLIFSRRISAAQIAALTAAAVGAEKKFGKYRDLVKDKLGKEEEEKIFVETAEEDCGITPPLPSKVDDYDDSMVFFDMYSGRYFVSSIERVQQAMYHLNRNFQLRGWALAGEFYELMGLKEIAKATPKCEKEGWSDVTFLEDYGMTPWIDFMTGVKESQNGVKYQVIYYDIEPTVEAIERVFG